MGLISFIKEAGAYLFGAGAGNAIAATQAKPVTTDILKQQVDILGIPVKDLKVAFADPVAEDHTPPCPVTTVEQARSMADGLYAHGDYQSAGVCYQAAGQYALADRAFMRAV